MTVNIPTLETKRLVLRRFTPEDIPAIYEIFSDPEVNRFLPWPPVSSMDEAREFYQAHYGQAYQKPAGYYYAICRKGDNVPIGYMGLGVMNWAMACGGSSGGWAAPARRAEPCWRGLRRTACPMSPPPTM